MKKKIIAAMMLCVTVIEISAQKTVDEEYVKIGNLNDKGYRFMSGFGFADTEVDAHSDTLEERVDAEIDRVLSGKAGSTSCSSRAQPGRPACNSLCNQIKAAASRRIQKAKGCNYSIRNRQRSESA